MPYTGILGGAPVIDHAGPMTKTALDCALLLEAMAGPVGIVDRQPAPQFFQPVKYLAEVEQHLQNTAGSAPLTGVRIGVLDEGFQHPLQDEQVEKVVRESIRRLSELGADVRRISIPEHRDSELVWMCALPAFCGSQGLVLNSSGRKQLALTEPAALGNGHMDQATWDAVGPPGQNLYLRWLFLQENYGPSLVSRCTNLLRKLSVCNTTTTTATTLQVLIQARLGRLRCCSKGSRCARHAHIARPAVSDLLLENRRNNRPTTEAHCRSHC